MHVLAQGTFSTGDETVEIDSILHESNVYTLAVFVVDWGTGGVLVAASDRDGAGGFSLIRNRLGTDVAFHVGTGQGAMTFRHSGRGLRLVLAGTTLAPNIAYALYH